MNKLDQLDWVLGGCDALAVALVSLVAGIMLDELIRFLGHHLIWVR